MNSKPSKAIIIIRNIVLSLLMIVALSIMDKLQASETDSTTKNSIEQIRINDVTSGSLLFKSDMTGRYTLAPTIETNVDMDINGIILRATITQEFVNNSDQWLEGVYVFPLPENAAVDHLDMRIGERRIKGFIQERKAARKTYQKAKAAGKKAALVEQQRPNIFTNSVANIGPGENITITIEYQQSLLYEKVNGSGKFSLRFPTTITPRYIPGQAKQVIEEEINQVATSGWALNTDQVPDASQITPPMFEDTYESNNFNLDIRLNAGFEIQNIISPYHNINVQHHDNNVVTISLRDQTNLADRDFKLTWKPSASIDPKAAIFSEQLASENYHFIMVMPPTAAIQGTQPLPREVIYIIDTSGSMSGDSIDQAKKSLHFAFNRLRPSDQFNIIQFNSNTSSVFPSARMANAANIRIANRYIDSLVADGGTEMLPALQAAMGPHVDVDETYIRQIMFLTDGAVGNESQLFAYIQQNLGNNRLFTIGIGSAPNSHFMSKAASFGRGTFTYIGAISEIQQQLEQLFAKLESPVLHDIQLSWPDDMNVEAWPAKLPDLYLGEPVLLSVKSPSDHGTVTISGTRANEQWRMELPLSGGKPSHGIAAVWARSQITALSDQMLDTNKKQRLQERITKVALQHHLVSKFTSLVAVDVTPTRPEQETLFIGPMPLNSPAGFRQMQLVGQLASTASPAPLHLLFGCSLLLLSVVSLRQMTSVFNSQRSSHS